jgi:hypothetical protein
MTSQFRSDNRHDDILGNIHRVFNGLGDNLEKDVRAHLKNVYATLTLSVVTAMVGVVANHIFK